MSWWQRNYVKVTHEPTGLSATADYTRSQYKCRLACYSMLKGMLWSLEHGAEQPDPTEAQKAIAESILSRINKRST
jgi:protein subunit release factor B